MARREDNLILFTSDQDIEKARINGRKGGIASGEAKRKKATMLSVLEKMLDEVIATEEILEELFRREMCVFKDWLIWNNDKVREKYKKEKNRKKLLKAKKHKRIENRKLRKMLKNNK